MITGAPEKIFIVDRRVSVTLYDTFHETFLILRSIILFELSKGEEADPDGDSSSNKMQDKAGSPKSEISSDQSKGATDAKSEDVITIVNDKGTLQSFIEKSPLGVQFAIIVLFYLARAYRSNTTKSKLAEKSDNPNFSQYSFTSKEFFNAYSNLAAEMGLTKFLIRHMAFAEFMLTLEYLALIREHEFNANYQFKIEFDDLKWLASIALKQITGGENLASPEIFYPSPRISPSTETPHLGMTVNQPIMANTNTNSDLIKELSTSIFSQEENELNLGSGTRESYDDFVRPRSRDYGIHRPYFTHRVPPTTYKFRKPDDGEWKRINDEFFSGQKCVTCSAQVLPDYFDIWIGEPLDDDATPESKRDQRMSEVLADIDSAAAFSHDVSTAQEQTINSDDNTTDRELLTYSYGIIPMDGKDAFIAFAKPKLPCPICGTNPANSVSLMPKY